MARRQRQTVTKETFDRIVNLMDRKRLNNTYIARPLVLDENTVAKNHLNARKIDDFVSSCQKLEVTRQDGGAVFFDVASAVLKRDPGQQFDFAAKYAGKKSRKNMVWISESHYLAGCRKKGTYTQTHVSDLAKVKYYGGA